MINRRIPYWWYITCCYVTWPVRVVLNTVAKTGWLSLLPDNLRILARDRPDFSYAVAFLWRNGFQRMYVVHTAQVESGVDLKSMLFDTYNNPFGIGVSPRSKMQDGAYNSKKTGEPIFATYRNVYRGVYDLYDLMYSRMPSYGAYLNNVPNEEFNPKSIANDTYISYVTLGWYKSGYFKANPVSRATTLKALARDTPWNPLWSRAINVLTVVILCVLLVLLWVYVLQRLVAPEGAGGTRGKIGRATVRFKRKLARRVRRRAGVA